jgi:hypothetical protein
LFGLSAGLLLVEYPARCVLKLTDETLTSERPAGALIAAQEIDLLLTELF